MTAIAVETTCVRRETDFVDRLVAGDERAFQQLFETHCRQVHRVARRFLRDDAEAEEVVQEVFINAFRAMGTFRREASMRTWLYRITVNSALKRLRWRKRRREVGDRPIAWEADRRANPERRAADREAMDVLEHALSRLSEAKRTVLLMHEVEGMDTQQIADALGCPRSTVLTRLARARREVVASAGRKGVRL